MMSNYKNFDRLNYKLYTAQIDLLERELEKSHQLEKSVFSGIVSSTVSIISASKFADKFSLPVQILIIIASYLIFYFLAYFVIYKAVDWIMNENKIHGSTWDDRAKIKICKDFDKIACHSLIMSQSYKECIDSVADKNLKELYLYEMIHYLEVAIRYTGNLINAERKCVNDGDLGYGVDKCRVVNVMNIMKDVITIIKGYEINIITNDHMSTKIKRMDAKIEQFRKSILISEEKS